MQIIRHRVNTVRELRRLDPAWGVECDVRSRGGRLILAHDPGKSGDPLDDFLKAAQGRLVIFNPKEDGLDEAIARLARARGVKEYFFLDLTIPSLVRLTRRDKRAAVRVSEFEPAAAAEPFRGRAAWAWLDCFTGKPPSAAAARALARSFRVCLVSPELQGYPVGRIRGFRRLAPLVDAVCTKRPDLWA